MSIPIFWRLILGNTGILFLSVLACLYSIVQLSTLSENARAALDGDHRMIGYQEALTDTLLSQVRYGGKYVITHVMNIFANLKVISYGIWPNLNRCRARSRSLRPCQK